MIFTIGHSTRTIGEFIGLLKAYSVTRLVDVRKMPGSRHTPQFNLEELSHSLKAEGIQYKYMPELGGLRRTTSGSPNTGWRNPSFRGFADYMQTPDFQQAIEDLIRMARRDTLAVMCAEAVPWRCHRSLIADALWVRGIPCEDILNAKRSQVHTLTPFAQVQGTLLVYPSETQLVAHGEPAAKVPRPTSRPKPKAKTKRGRQGAEEDH